MKVGNVLEEEKTKSYHYVFLGTAEFKKVFKKLQGLLKYYRLENVGKTLSREVVYDVANNLLSDSGIVLSKQYSDDKIMFKVRKISQLPGAMKRPSKKFILGELETDAEPRDYSLEISSAIDNSFSTSFTVDLDSFVKQTMPKIEIEIRSTKYKIIGGTGYRAFLLYETTTYKDLKTNKKVQQEGLTLNVYENRENEKENNQILKLIEDQVKEIAIYKYSRFEIAQKLLYPKEIVKNDDDNMTD